MEPIQLRKAFIMMDDSMGMVELVANSCEQSAYLSAVLIHRIIT